VLYKYPQQALWLFTSVLHSRKENRRTRGEGIINQVRVSDNRQG
jgi:serine/threonine-protein kinase ATR